MSFHGLVLTSLDGWVSHNIPSHSLSYKSKQLLVCPHISPVHVCLGAFVSCQQEPFSQSLPIKILLIPQILAQMGSFLLSLTSVRTSLSLLCTQRGLDLPSTIVTRILSLSPICQIPGSQEACFFHFLYSLQHGGWQLLITLNCAVYLRSRKPSIIAFTSSLISSPHKEFF